MVATLTVGTLARKTFEGSARKTTVLPEQNWQVS
jgi:hypothetical protein